MLKTLALLGCSLVVILSVSQEIQAQDCSRPGTCRGRGNVNPRPPADRGRRINPSPRPSRPPAPPARVGNRPARPPAPPARVGNRPVRPPAPPTRVDHRPVRSPYDPGRLSPNPRRPVNPGRGYSTPVRPRRPAPARVPTDYRRDSRWDYQRAQTYHNRYRHFDNWHRPNARYNRVRHNPYYSVPRHNVAYYTPRDYYYHLSYRDIYWNQWIRVRLDFNDGYHWYNNYPYYVYNGYRHRYSPVEYCDYELVDGWNNETHTTYHGQTCQSAYDSCASLRDDLNFYADDYRYFCSERFFDDPFSYDHWDFYDDFYSSHYQN